MATDLLDIKLKVLAEIIKTWLEGVVVTSLDINNR